MTHALATLYMVHWVRIFRQKLSEAAVNSPSFSLYLSQVYVDNKNISCEALPLGSRLINGKIQIVEEEITNDNDIPADITHKNIKLYLIDHQKHWGLDANIGYLC